MVIHLYIAIGSALGGMARYWCTNFTNDILNDGFPWGTIIVNVLGSFAIGIFAALAITTGKYSIYPNMQKFMIVGICGGYTTFSSFSLDTLKLLQKEEFFKAGINVSLSFVLCLISVYVGYVLALQASTFLTK